MIVHYPANTAMLSEARLYATDSIMHTMDYNGWKDQHQKRERITYGKFGQLWVTEFCRLNGVPHQKDRSSPKDADDVDLVVRGQLIDVKTSVCQSLVGQVSPGVLNKPCDYFCFLLTDKACSYVAPYGLIEADVYRKIAVEVKQGDLIPGTGIQQRFGSSFFLPENPELIPFVRFMSFGKTERRVIQPSTIVDGRDMESIDVRMGNLERLMIQVVGAFAAQTKKPRTGNVANFPANADLFGDTAP